MYDKSIEVVGTIGTAKDAIQMVVEKEPNVVLMDSNLPDSDSITAITTMRRKVPYVEVAVMSDQEDMNYMRRASLAGARGFLTKPPDMNELGTTIKSLYELSVDQKKRNQPGLPWWHIHRSG